MTETHRLVLRDGIQLSLEIVETGAKEWLIINHGMGEHHGRHQFLKDLFSYTYNLLFYDLRGHGRSQGKRAWVHAFEDYEKDLEEILLYLCREFDLRTFNLFGHSMGGLIVAGFTQSSLPLPGEKFSSFQAQAKRVFLSAPAISASGIKGRFFFHSPKFLLNSLSHPKKGVYLKGMLNLQKLSHDPRVFHAYINDELAQTSLHSHLLFETMRRGQEVFSRPLRFAGDLYCAYGSQDELIHPEILKEYFAQVEKGAKTLCVEGGFHELHNETLEYREPYFRFLKGAFDLV